MRMLVAAGTFTLVVLFALWTGAVSAVESTPSAGDHAQTGASDADQGKHTGNAECPIKKTINGVTYCFQNNPALTKRQGGGE
ncbi:hypothetical protein [Methyloceanibacter sp.]|uniref:hypothetical protein n=1 Tax=Methyloceanibacter sp. TaxID=1965321 RepID=UPI002D5E68E6|nr:hypothetical protein [Methyloceanibacter sp.]HZP10611.1 hypothetical protein [Methyloceanibacter sp.]